MDKRIVIVVGFAAVLGLGAGAFLFFGKKKPAVIQTPSAGLPVQVDNKASAPNTTTKTMPGATTKAKPAAPKTSTTTSTTQAAKEKAVSQWQACKAKTTVAGTNLFWSVQISEGIPAGGTYAKGNLNGDKNYPVRVIIKSDSKIAAQIKARLIVGKAAFLRGNCSEVATDGAVILQAF